MPLPPLSSIFQLLGVLFQRRLILFITVLSMLCLLPCLWSYSMPFSCHSVNLEVTPFAVDMAALVCDVLPRFLTPGSPLDRTKHMGSFAPITPSQCSCCHCIRPGTRSPDCPSSHSHHLCRSIHTFGDVCTPPLPHCDVSSGFCQSRLHSPVSGQEPGAQVQAGRYPHSNAASASGCVFPMAALSILLSLPTGRGL